MTPFHAFCITIALIFITALAVNVIMDNKDKIGIRRRVATRRRVPRDQLIRDWAIDHGFKMGYKGRIPIAALNAYRAANKPKPKPRPKPAPKPQPQGPPGPRL
jgi:hypothetical protein